MTFYIPNQIINYYASSEDELKQYQVGDTIIVSGNIKEPTSQRNFHLFNYKHYLLSLKINSIIEADQITKVSSDCNLLFQLKRWMIKRIEKIDNTGYMFNFILGDNSKVDSETTANYRINGISHLFSISGMHITLFSSILFFLLNLIYKNKHNFIIVFLILLIYVFLTGGSPSIIRGVGFFLVLNVNRYFNLKIKTLILFIYFICVMLLFNPYLVYHTGFLFSYTISFYLILFQGGIAKYKSYINKLLITSSISFMASIPILIQTNFSINALSIILNLFFVPLVSFIIFPLSLITFIIPMFYPLLNLCIILMETTSNWCADVNGLTLVLCAIPFYIVPFYYLIITFIIHKLLINEYKYIVVLIVILLGHHFIGRLDSRALVSMIDVGQGDSILIKLPNQRASILIDTGGIVSYNNEPWQIRNKKSTIADSTIIPYLKSIGIDHLDYLILTHGDYDHIGEAINLINHFKVKAVIFNSGNNNDLEKEVIKLLKIKKIPYTNISQETIKIHGYPFYFINDINEKDENEDSLVFYTNIYNKKILMTGDSGIDSEKDWLMEYNLPKMDILKIGHHGSNGSTSDDLLNTIKPDYAIISAGVNNRFGHPHKEVLAKLNSIPTYVTSINGMIEIYIKSSILVNAVR